MNKTSVLKKLTGQDVIGFEYKNKKPFEDINYAKIIIATNNLPATTDKTIGFYRRWLLIDFPNQFTEEKDILDSIPDSEYGNLATRCIVTLHNLMDKKGFHNEGNIEERMQRYEDKSNPFDKFWVENIIEDPDGFISKKRFNNKLSEWCKVNRFRSMTDVAIGRHMKIKSVETVRKTMDWADVPIGQDKPRYWAWEGIKLRGTEVANE